VANHSIAVFKHPGRTCVFQEFSTCAALGFDYSGNLAAHEDSLRRQKYPHNWGLTENCCIVRRNDAKTKEFNEAWLLNYFEGSMRDQLSFMPTVWSTGFRPNLNVIEGNSRKNRFYIQGRHLRDRRVTGDLSVSIAQKRVISELNRSRAHIHS
jgi:hypothetical protein